ncbi:MAG: TRAP transporter small permease subunit [Pseudomonadota bacterium]
MAYVLTELAHVRIDLIRLRLRSMAQALMDLFAITALAGTTIVIAVQGWPVLSKTLERGSRANTPLETPLWIPQVFWLSGWVWFATCASLLVLLTLVLLWQRDLKQADALVGARSELELEQ